MTTTAFVNGVTLTDSAWFNDVDTATYPLTAVAGTNTITATGPSSLSAYASGQVLKFIPANTNSGATTINVSGLGAKNVFANGSACTGGELVANVPNLLYYDGTQFNIVGYQRVPTNNIALGQCRLSTPTTTSLKLSPLNGNLLTVNGTNCTIPDAGVTLAAAPALANTTYYIYAVATSGVITSIEASTTAYSISTTAGNKGTPIKTGDDTRTLVGMARGNNSTQWADTTAQRFVLNYWQRRPLNGLGSFSATVRQTASAVFVEIDSTVRTEFLTWADSEVGASFNTDAGNNSGASPSFASLYLDGTTAKNTVRTDCTGANAYNCVSAAIEEVLSEGYHYYTIFGATNGSGSANFASTLASNVLKVRIFG